MDRSRLVPLISMSEYEKALKDGPTSGGVAAIIEECAYKELFLETRYEFRVIGLDFTMSGWGFLSINPFFFCETQLHHIIKTRHVIQSIKPGGCYKHIYIYIYIYMHAFLFVYFISNSQYHNSYICTVCTK